MVGEVAQEAGRDGVRRAKRWLERTGRVDVYWTVYEHPSMLTVTRPGSSYRSFDLGGVIRGGDLDGHQLFAEVKNYTSASDQPNLYGDYLANAYCKMLEDRRKLYQFMWITWHPFSLNKWAELCKPSEVRQQISKRQPEWLGSDASVDTELCRIVADRLWLIVLSEKQERLCMSRRMLGELRRRITMETRP